MTTNYGGNRLSEKDFGLGLPEELLRTHTVVVDAGEELVKSLV